MVVCWYGVRVTTVTKRNKVEGDKAKKNMPLALFSCLIASLEFYRSIFSFFFH